MVVQNEKEKGGGSKYRKWSHLFDFGAKKEAKNG